MGEERRESGRDARDEDEEGGYGHPERYTRDLTDEDEHVADRPPRRAEEGPPPAEDARSPRGA